MLRAAGEWREEFQEIKHQLLALTSEINRHSQTTRNNEEIGKVGACSTLKALQHVPVTTVEQGAWAGCPCYTRTPGAGQHMPYYVMSLNMPCTTRATIQVPLAGVPGLRT